MLLKSNSSQSLDVLGGKGDIFFRICRNDKGSKATLDAKANLEGVGREFIHCNLDGSSTATLMLGKLSEIVHYILADRVMERFEHQLRDHVIRELVSRREVQATVILPVENTGKGNEVALLQEIDHLASIGSSLEVKVLIHLNGG
jgi:hypothetical protein